MAGVHWGYEETKTFLDILRETRFYEALQACHRKSKLYGAVAEQLQECGFLRTPEQCRTKFKSLQKSYRKVKNGHVLESCAFYKEMDALINSRASAPPTSTPEEAPSPSIQEREDIEIEPQEPTGWEPEEDSQEAIVEDSSSERLSEEEIVPEPEFQGPPGLLQSPSGKDHEGLWSKEEGSGIYWQIRRAGTSLMKVYSLSRYSCVLCHLRKRGRYRWIKQSPCSYGASVQGRNLDSRDLVFGISASVLVCMGQIMFNIS